MSNDKMKNIFLFVLLVLFIVFFALWYFKPSDTKDLNKIIEEQIARNERLRDSLHMDIQRLEENSRKLEDSIEMGRKRIVVIDNQLKVAQTERKVAKTNVQTEKDFYDKLLKKLEALESHPVQREGNELLQSLKDKLK